MKNSTLFGLGLFGAGFYLFNKNKNSNKNEVSGSSDISESKEKVKGSISENSTGMTKKQIHFITDKLESTNDNPTTITETSLNNKSRVVVNTDKKNIKKVENSISTFGNSDTIFIYKDENKNIVGGSDFGNMQSLTKKSAKNYDKTRSNPIVNISRGVKINHNSTGINGLTDSGKKPTTKKVVRDSNIRDKNNFFSSIY